MINEENKQQVENEMDVNEFVQAYKDMQENKVDRELWLKEKKEKAELIKAMARGETIEVEKKKERPSEQELKDKIRNAETLLDGVTSLLELRDYNMEKGLPDPLFPHSSLAEVTEQDKVIAQKCLDAYKHCIDYAQGDPVAFAAELSRLTVDTANPILKARRK